MMMKPAYMLKLLTAALVAAVVSLSGPAFGKDAMSRPWMPAPAKAEGKCDADPVWMRKWHMKVLTHKRDDTMYDGIRTDQFSLKRCITCHAVKDEAGSFVKVSDERHFCRACHDYSMVHMDCFDCHASRPGEADKQAVGLPGGEPQAHLPAGHPGDVAHAGDVMALQKHFGGQGQ